MKTIEGQLNAQGRRFAIVVGRFNSIISNQLLDGAVDCLVRHGGDRGKITVAWVPGSFEVPLLARKLADSGKHDAVICLGVLIRGQTPHFDFIAAEATKGIAQIGLQTGIPATFGVITADSLEQAIERAGSKAGNKGWEAALAAIEMADLYANLKL